MKFFITLITILTLTFQVKSQTKIIGYEYWFDNNYANKVTPPVSPIGQLNINTAISTTGINEGIHSFNFRSWDDSARYSSIVSQFFYKVGATTSINRDIVAYEYWFDNDYANAVKQTVASQQSFDLNTIIATGAMTNGIHAFNIRFKDNTEFWSSTLSRFFYKVGAATSTNRDIVAYEYWFDNDYANAVKQTVASQQSLDLNTIIATGAMTNGIHAFNIRFKDNTEFWSSTLSQFFYKVGNQPNLASNKITTYRYWFDNGFAQANTVMLPTATKNLNLINDLDLSQIVKGKHSIHFQFKDTLNRWSVVTSDSLEKLAFPIADFSYTSSVSCDSTTVSFTDNSIDADNYLWDFGDGNTSATANPIHAFYNTGVYQVSLTISDSLTGRDSSITIPVSVNKKTTSSSVIVDECNSYTAPDGVAYTTSGIKTAIIPNAENCDSVITINLTIKNATASSVIESACNSYTAPDGVVYTTSGIKTAIIPNTENCDSTITINLTINTIDTSVVQVLNTLTSNAAGASYQWLDCDNGNNPVSGETNQAYTATANGNYAVQVTKNGCIATSTCFTIRSVGIIENDFGNDIALYPNPIDDNFLVDLGTIFELIKITITDINGKLIQSNAFDKGQIVKMSLAEPSGIYMLTIQAGDKKAVIRLLKQ